MLLILTLIVVFLILVGSELWWRSRVVHEEFSRKFVHITVGSFVAFWPFFLSWPAIELLSLAFFVVVITSKYLKIFQAIHSVQRPTWGELFFAISVGLIAVMTHDKWIYMAALLQMSLADGLAAVFGIRFGARFRYSVFGHAKSVVGTLTFFIVSMLILAGYMHYGHGHLGVLPAIGIAAVASIIENFGIQGFDNLLVPVFVAVMLRIVG